MILEKYHKAGLFSAWVYNIPSNVNKCYILSILIDNYIDVVRKETAQWIVTVLTELLGVRKRIPIEGNIVINIRRLK